MTKTLLPQKHCNKTDDHKAHTVWTPVPLAPEFRCPGRFTPTGFLTDQPIAHPMDSDPFSCIPGAYED